MTGISYKDLVNSENYEAKSCLQMAVDGGHVEVGFNSFIAHKLTTIRPHGLIREKVY